jgi:hypothetical protein
LWCSSTLKICFLTNSKTKIGVLVVVDFLQIFIFKFWCHFGTWKILKQKLLHSQIMVFFNDPFWKRKNKNVNLRKKSAFSNIFGPPCNEKRNLVSPHRSPSLAQGSKRNLFGFLRFFRLTESNNNQRLNFKILYFLLSPKNLFENKQFQWSCEEFC